MERIRDFWCKDDTTLSIEVPYTSDLRWWDDDGEHVESHTDNLAAIDAYLRRLDDWLAGGALPMGPWVTYYKPHGPEQSIRLPVTPLLSTRVDGQRSDTHHPSLSDALVALNRWIDARQKEGYRPVIPSWDGFEKPGSPWVESCSATHHGFHHSDDSELEFGPEMFFYKDGEVSSALIQVQTQAHGHRWAIREGGTLGYIDTSHRDKAHGELFLFNKNGLLKGSRREGPTRTLHFIAFNEEGALDVRMLDGMDTDGKRIGKREEFFDDHIMEYEFHHGVMLSQRKISHSTGRVVLRAQAGPTSCSDEQEIENAVAIGEHYTIDVNPAVGRIRAASCDDKHYTYPVAMFGPTPLPEGWFPEFSVLKEIVKGEPSRTNWLELCGVLERLYRQDPVRCISEALPVARAVASWPASMRMAPWLWINKLIVYALPVAFLELLSALSLTAALSGSWTAARGPMLAEWLSQIPEDLSALEGLHLSFRGEVLRQIEFIGEDEPEARFRAAPAADSREFLGGDLLELILASPLARSLRVLDISFDEPPWDYLRNQPGPLEGRTISLARVSSLLQTPEALESLDLQGNALRSEHTPVTLPKVRAFNACESSPPIDADLQQLAATLPGLEALTVVPHCVGWLLSEPWPDDADLQHTLTQYWGVTEEDALRFTATGLTALLDALPLQRLTLQDAYEDLDDIQAALKSASNLDVEYTTAHGGYVRRSYRSDWDEHFVTDSV